jgi:hypothetical protein
MRRNLSIKTIYTLNNGQRVSEKEIQTAYNMGSAVIVFYKDERMTRPAVGLMLSGQGIDDSRPFHHHTGVIERDLGRWTERPSSLQQCLDIAAGQTSKKK